MTGIPETNWNFITDLYPGVIGTSHKMRHGILCICHRVHGYHQFIACTSGFPVLPLCFCFLNMTAVFQHDLTKVNRCICSINLPFESFFKHQRNQAGMINVCMGHQNIIQAPRGNRNFLILVNISPLLHTAVHKQFTRSDFQIMTAACYFMRCTNEFKLHKIPLLFYLSGEIRRCRWMIFLFHNI